MYFISCTDSSGNACRVESESVMIAELIGDESVRMYIEAKDPSGWLQKLFFEESVSTRGHECLMLCRNRADRSYLCPSNHVSGYLYPR